MRNFIAKLFCGLLGVFHYSQGEVFKIIGEQSLVCQKSNICKNTIELTKTISTSDFHLSDTPHRDSNPAIWDDLVGSGTYNGKDNNDVTIYIKPTTTRKIQGGPFYFQLRRICFKAQNAGSVTLIIINTRYEWHDWRRQQEDTKEIEQGSKGVCFFRGLFATELRIVLRPSSFRKPAGIRRLTVKGCTDIKDVDFSSNLFEFEEAKTPWNKTRTSCEMQYQLPDGGNFFTFRDDDNNSDNEKKALADSKTSYYGRKGKSVTFRFEARDGQMFESWSVCVEVKGVHQIIFSLIGAEDTYKETITICDHKAYTRKCYAPWNRQIIVKSGTFKLVKHRQAEQVEAKEVRITGCRDHFHNNYVLSTNPGDYKVLTINSIRNRTFTIYGTKDANGHLIRSELYHYKDYTGNHGDNTWFTLNEDFLVDTIWTPQDFIKLGWDLKNKKQLHISVVARKGLFTAELFFDTDKLFRHLFLTPDNEIPKRKRATDEDFVKKVTVKISTECKKKHDFHFVYDNHEVLPNQILPARATGRPGEFEFLLPTGAAPKQRGPIRQQCSQLTKVKTAECKKSRSVMTRQVYRFICFTLRLILLEFTEKKQEDISRIHEACDQTFRTLNVVCDSITGGKTNRGPKFFTTACRSKKKFTTDDLYSITTEKVNLTVVTKDLNSRFLSAPKQTVNVKSEQQAVIKIESQRFQLLDIIFTPAKPVLGQEYSIELKYSCAHKSSRIELHLTGENLLNRFEKRSCNNLSKGCKQTFKGNNVVKIDPDKPAGDHIKIEYAGGGKSFIRDTYIFY